MKIISKIFVIISLAIIVFISYLGFKIFFKSNTSFEDNFVYFYVKSGSSSEDLINSISNYITDIDTFTKAAKAKKYLENIKAGRFKLNKGDNNNNIINSLRSKNIPVKVTFWHQQSSSIDTISYLHLRNHLETYAKTKRRLHP